MRFVLKSHNANASKQKIKHIILLLMRMGAIALVAMLLAGFYLQGNNLTGSRQVPTAMVVVIDNSASMSYQHKSRTFLEYGKQIVTKIVESLPNGSRVAVLSTSGGYGDAGFLNDVKLASLQISDIPQTHGGDSVGDAVVRAVGMLHDSKLPRNEVLVISDMTNTSWKSLSEIPTTNEIKFTIIDCGIDRDANISLHRVKLSSQSVPLGVGVTLRTIISSRNLGGEMNLLVELDGQNIQQRSVELPVGGSRVVRFTIYPDKTGVLHGRVVLQNPDPLQSDNVRYFTLEVREPVEILFVTSPANKNDKTAFLMANAIAPPMPRTDAGMLTRRNITPDQLDKEKPGKTPLVVLANTGALRSEQWKALSDYVTGGGKIWIVAGSMLNIGSYNSPQAQQIMPVKLKGQEELSRPTGFAEPDVTAPLFLPFTDPENPPLGEIMIYNRFGIESVAPNAAVALKYIDNTPAIINRKVGKGEVVFWNFSPARNWSNLGQLGAQLVVLTDRTLELLLDVGQTDIDVDSGRTVEVTIPENYNNPAVEIQKSGDETSSPLEADLHRGIIAVTPEKPGRYTVKFREGNVSAVRGFSANVPESQSDLRKIPRKDLSEKFPRGRLSIINSLEDRKMQIDTESRKLELLPVFLIVLLVLLTAESFFANRFYKKPASETNAE